MLAALHRAGARLLAGADSPQLYSVPGFSLLRELHAMEAAGVPRAAVLDAATRGPAEYFGRSHEFGRVAVGMRADLLLLEGNPLDDLHHLERPAGVMVRGCWLSREEIDGQLEAIAERATRVTTAARRSG
jgi:imidazolonepropionase-like amidohydrolase